MDYKDSSYWDKRRILKEYYSADSHAKNAIKFVGQTAKDKLKEPILERFLDINLIYDYLITGYLTFVSDKYGNWKMKDPCNLVPRTNKDNKIVWDLWEWKEVIDEYDTKDVLYVSFPTKFTSLVEMLYLGELKSVDLYEPSNLEYYSDIVVDSLTTYFLNVDKILKANNELKRAFKLKKLMKNECTEYCE